MKKLTVKQYHSEGSTRPVALGWISNESLFVASNSGIDQIQYNYKNNDPTHYYNESSVIRLITSEKDCELTILRENFVEIITENNSQIQSKLIELPTEINTYARIIWAKNENLILVVENGDIWVNNASCGWNKTGTSSLKKITVIKIVNDLELLICNAEGLAEVINLNQYTIQKKNLLHSDSIQDVVILSDNRVITVGRDKALRCWNFTSKYDLEWSLENLHEHFINCCLQVNNEIWTGSSDGSIAIVSLREHELIHIFFPHKDSIRSLSLSRDGLKVVSLSDDGTYKVFDSQTRNVLFTHGTLRKYTRCAQIRNYSSALNVVIGNTNGSIKKGIIDTYHITEDYICNNSLRAICYITENIIITGDDAGHLHIVNNNTNTTLTSKKTGAGITALLFLKDNKTLLCGYRDGYIRKYSLEISQNDDIEDILHFILEKKIHETIVGDIVEYDKNTILTCSDDRTIKRSFVVSLTLLHTLISSASTAINNIAITNKYIVATSDSGSIYIFHRNTLEEKNTYNEHFSPVRAIENIDDELVCTGSRTGEIRIWSTETLETFFIRKFRERILYLYMDKFKSTIYIVTEGELVSINLSSLLQEITIDEDKLTQQSVNSIIKKYGKPLFHSKSKEIEIAIKSNKKHFQLKKGEEVLLKQFTASKDGVLCEVEKLNSGFSGARVFRVKVISKDGATRIHSVAKMGSGEIISNEVSNYEDEIARLPPNATPRLLGRLNCKDNNINAVFYSLAEDYKYTFFDILIANQKMVPSIVKRLEKYFYPWRNGIPMETKTIKQVRETLLKSTGYKKILNTYDLQWAVDFEKEIINTMYCTTHGDLHGSNILVNNDCVPIVIDYGDVGLRAASIDAVTLELSTHFHPSGPLATSSSFSSELARKWGTEEYIYTSENPEVTASFFAWAESVSAGNREIAASAYSYLMWQLKFSSSNKDKILDFLVGVRNYYTNT